MLADAITWARAALAPAIFAAAAFGQGRVAFLGLLLAGGTDVLDGWLARRAGPRRESGARLDTLADFLVLIATAISVQVLHPELLRDGWTWLAATAVIYAASWGSPARASTKVAGALLYGFALFTLGTGVYVPALLWVAALALAASSVDGILRARITILLKPRMSTTRSHAPQALNGVESKTTATASVVTSAMPSMRKTRP